MRAAPHRRVSVDAGNRVVFLDDLQEALDVVAHAFRCNRGVFDERNRLAVAFHRRRQSSAASAAPDALLRRRVDDTRRTAAEAHRQLAFGSLERFDQVVDVIPANSMHEALRHDRRIAPGGRRRAWTTSSVTEDERIHYFDGGGTCRQDEGRAERIEDMLELDGEHHARRGQRHEPHARFDDDEVCPLGSTMILVRSTGASPSVNASRL